MVVQREEGFDRNEGLNLRDGMRDAMGGTVDAALVNGTIFVPSRILSTQSLIRAGMRARRDFDRTLDCIAGSRDSEILTLL